MNIFNEVTLILISYNSEKKIIEFIKSIPQLVKIIVIENSNNTKLAARIKKINKKTKVFLRKNNGYGASLNYAVKLIDTKYFLLIGADIKIDIDDLEIFQQYAKLLKDNFGSLGPRYLDVNNKGHKQIDLNVTYGSIDSIHGSCMFFNKKKFNLLGGFDENIFLYFEETEYCYRAKKKGLLSYQINKIKVKVNGRSVEIKNKKKNEKLKKLLIWHYTWSKFYFYKKKYGQTYALLLFIPIIFRTKFKIYLNKLLKNKKKLEKYTIRMNSIKKSIKGEKSNLRIEML